MTDRLSKKIKAIRGSLGMNQADFADTLETTQSTVSRWERGSKPEPQFLQAIAKMAGTTVDVLLGVDSASLSVTDQIPIVGYVGAGAEVIPFDDYSHGDGMDYIERPAFVDGRAVAVEIRGDSLYPTAENGWKLIYAGDQTLDEVDVLNRLCIVKLADERILVKRVTRGTQPSRYHLVSTNAPVIEDAEVLWAARVKAIIPN